MKFINLICILVIITFSGSSAAGEKFALDSQHGHFAWNVKQTGHLLKQGQWPATGTLVVDKINPAKNYLEAKIAIDDITTGDDELDSQLKLLSSLNSHFAYANFTSNHIKFITENNAIIQGRIHLFGMSIPVTLHAHFTPPSIALPMQMKTLAFQATTLFKIKQLPPILQPKNISPRDQFELEVNASLKLTA
jgi:polyisoprenoid-binding protein YceI